MAVEAALCLVLARLLVRRVPMRYWGGRLRGEAAGSAPADRQGMGRIVGRIVRRVARRLPVEVVCLPRAMAAHWMLRRRGVSSHVVFGARRAATGRRPDYHAWLTVDGGTVMGGRNSPAYTPLLAPGRSSARGPEEGARPQ